VSTDADHDVERDPLMEVAGTSVCHDIGTGLLRGAAHLPVLSPAAWVERNTGRPPRATLLQVCRTRRQTELVLAQFAEVLCGRLERDEVENLHRQTGHHCLVGSHP